MRDRQGGITGKSIVLASALAWYFYLHFNKAETRPIAGLIGGAATIATICTVGGAEGGPVVAAAMGAACLAYAGTIVYQAGVARNSSPERCLLIKFRVPNAGMYQIGTHRDLRCA